MIPTFFIVGAPMTKRQHELYVIGWSQRPDCTCVDRDANCLEGISYDPKSCWGSPQVNTVELIFQLSYLALNFGFAALIGLLMLDKHSQKASQEQSRPRSTKKKTRRKQSAKTERTAVENKVLETKDPTHSSPDAPSRPERRSTPAHQDPSPESEG